MAQVASHSNPKLRLWLTNRRRPSAVSKHKAHSRHICRSFFNAMPLRTANLAVSVGERGMTAKHKLELLISRQDDIRAALKKIQKAPPRPGKGGPPPIGSRDWRGVLSDPNVAHRNGDAV
jgi:hypothetical protein